MKFSFRYFLAFVILISSFALVTRQVLLSLEKNPHLPLASAISENINPFWKLPDETIIKNSSVKIPVTITNPTEKNIIPTGEITLWKKDGTQLRHIAVLNEKGNPPGKLVDSLTINPENITLSGGQTRLFETEWRGFGDEYLEKKNLDE